MNRLNRISALLVQLQSRSLVKASQMAECFGVSLRTIYRDIRTLSEAGIPICGDAGVGYSLVDGYKLPPLMFSKEEAMAFLTAEKFIEQLTDSQNRLYFRQGMDKIRAVMQNVDKDYMSDLDRSITVYRSRNTPDQRFPNLLQTILGSINDRKILRIEYTNIEDKTSERDVEAVGVSYSYPCWYLTAWCHLCKEYRTFRLDRINNLSVTMDVYTMEHPELESLLGKEDETCLVKTVLQTSPQTARRNADACRFMGLIEEYELDNGLIEQIYMSYSIENVARWVLANADSTFAISPPELKERIKEIIENIKL